MTRFIERFFRNLYWNWRRKQRLEAAFRAHQEKMRHE